VKKIADEKTTKNDAKTEPGNNTPPPAEPGKTTPPPANPPEAGNTALNSMEMATKVAERLDAKMKEIEKKEASLDKKMKDFDAFVKATEIEGQTMAGQAPMTADQEAIKAANAMLDGTGMNPFAGEGAKALK